MARSPIDLPRMQNQPRLRVAVARAPNLVPQDDEPPPKRRKPRMMRQFELIDRVKQYNPAANEDLLNRAYVYAMRAHGEQKRASGDPYFSHPLQVAAILTDLKSRRRHHRRGAPARHDRRHRRHPRRDRSPVRP